VDFGLRHGALEWPCLPGATVRHVRVWRLGHATRQSALLEAVAPGLDWLPGDNILFPHRGAAGVVG